MRHALCVCRFILHTVCILQETGNRNKHETGKKQETGNSLARSLAHRLGRFPAERPDGIAQRGHGYRGVAALGEAHVTDLQPRFLPRLIGTNAGERISANELYLQLIRGGYCAFGHM